MTGAACAPNVAVSELIGSCHGVLRVDHILRGLNGHRWVLARNCGKREEVVFESRQLGLTNTVEMIITRQTVEDFLSCTEHQSWYYGVPPSLMKIQDRR